MHEMSLAMEIIELVRPSIPEGESLKGVGVTVGLLAGVCADSLRFCFEELARVEGFPAARLELDELPARYCCISCDKTYETRSVEQPCPGCGAFNRTLLSGAEFSVEYIEV